MWLLPPMVQDSRKPPLVFSHSPLASWPSLITTSGKHFWYFSERTMSRHLTDCHRTRSSVCEPQMWRMDNMRVKVHAWSIWLKTVDLDRPVGMFMSTSCSLSLPLKTNSMSFCISSHRYLMCQFQTGVSGTVTSQNSLVKSKNDSRQIDCNTEYLE